jgi:glycine cleavage system H protein
MDPGPPNTVPYQRANFATQLPTDYAYSPAHGWAARQAEGQWRVGLTRFATRMLGEIVDHGFQAKVGAPVQVGEIIGWIEGFKAISDLYCLVEGRFLGGNPALQQKPELVNQDPYGAGWLYQVEGVLDARCVDVAGYAAILDATIDRLRQKQQAERPEAGG